MIRRFRPDDLDAIITIWLDASIEAHHFIDPAFWHARADDMREIYIPASETYVETADEAVRGFFCLHEKQLAALFVAPGHQGLGIGRRLLQEALRHCPDLTIDVYKQNTRGIGFYERCGFRAVSEKVDEHTGHEELVMARRL